MRKLDISYLPACSVQGSYERRSVIENKAVNVGLGGHILTRDYGHEMHLLDLRADTKFTVLIDFTLIMSDTQFCC